jgi:hypothetical protein
VAISWCQNGGNKPERARSIVLGEKGVEGGLKKRESPEHDALAEAVVVSGQERWLYPRDYQRDTKTRP